ncbi:MAG: rhodanese-like domain-containing protein [Rickettsiales bacterium]|nr:rhodanese-like domain-containing protein [Rickettsiales bacterium]
MPLKTIDAPTLKNWLEKREALLVDVREPAEYAAEHIQGATLMPLGSISKAALPHGTGKKLVIHCRKGARGGSACDKLLSEDPTLDLYNLEGGIEAWSAAGLAVETSGKAFLPLDRQVQLTIGLLLMTASLLGYVLTPAFFLVTGLIGCGLALAGATGFCGLALLIAKMPWNQNVTPATCAAK